VMVLGFVLAVVGHGRASADRNREDDDQDE
jgi:hypothetical protein